MESQMTQEAFNRIDVGQLRAEGYDTFHTDVESALSQASGQNSFIAALAQQMSVDQGGAPNELAQVAASLFRTKSEQVRAVNVLDLIWSLHCMFMGPGPDERAAWAMFTTWAMQESVVGSPSWDLSAIR
jgi:hypothetical protein